MTNFVLFRKSFYFLRHGETDWNLKNLFQGNTDIPLNEKGLLQAERVKEKVNLLPISHIFSSDLKRAKKTAYIINNQLNLKVFFHKGLQECAFGFLEGQDVDSNRSYVKQWLKGKVHEGAEPFKDFKCRVINTVNDCLRMEGLPLLVAHGGVCMTLTEYMGYEKPIQIGNCEIVLFEPPLSGNLWNIVRL